MKKYIKLITVFVTVVIPLMHDAFGQAQGYYLTVGGGYVIPSRNSSTTATSNAVLYAPTRPGASLFDLPNMNWKNNYSQGGEISIALGKELFQHVRGEAEFLYQTIKRQVSGSYDWQEVNAYTGDLFASQLGNPISETSNRLRVYSLLGNVYYDFKNSSKWTPFVGVGIGAARIQSGSTSAINSLNIDDLTVNLTQTAPTLEKSPSINDTTFAAQLKLGLSYDVNPHFSISAIYRLFATAQFGSHYATVTTNPNTTDSAVFTIPNQQVNGLLNSGFDLSMNYLF